MTKENLILAIVILSSLIGILSLMHIVYSQVGYREADFYVYVPENASIQKEKNYFGYESKYVETITLNNTTLKFIRCGGIEKLLDYKGCYVVVKVRYSVLDDENAYMRRIEKITIQENETLGYYPHGIYYDRYFHEEAKPVSNLSLLGLLGFLPLLILISYIAYVSKEELK